MQSISPKKIILKFKRKLKKTDSLADGVYKFQSKNGEDMEAAKVFKKFQQAERNARKVKTETAKNAKN